jgi:hypothetical protein
MTFVGYNEVVSTPNNLSSFVDKNEEFLFNRVKQQCSENAVFAYSYAHYDSLLKVIAFHYCLNLFFLILERLENETIEESEIKLKEQYKFKEVQTNLAHNDINLDEIYNDILINFTPEEYDG